MSRTMRAHGVATAFRPHTTLRKVLVHPKDKIDRDNVCGSVYQIGCANCDSVYIGESARKFGKRLSEHVTNVENNAAQGVRTRSTRLRNTGTRHKSAITDHVVDHNHVPDWENSKVVCKGKCFSQQTNVRVNYHQTKC